MEFKKANFEASSIQYLNCVPAIGEKRKFWGSKIMRTRRQHVLAKLKKERKFQSNGCVRRSTQNMAAWKQLSFIQKTEYEKDLKYLLEMPVGIYSSQEINWIRKTYRILKQSPRKDNYVQKETDSHEHKLSYYDYWQGKYLINV